MSSLRYKYGDDEWSQTRLDTMQEPWWLLMRSKDGGMFGIGLVDCDDDDDVDGKRMALC